MREMPSILDSSPQTPGLGFTHPMSKALRFHNLECGGILHIAPPRGIRAHEASHPRGSDADRVGAASIPRILDGAGLNSSRLPRTGRSGPVYLIKLVSLRGWLEPPRPAMSSELGLKLGCSMPGGGTRGVRTVLPLADDPSGGSATPRAGLGAPVLCYLLNLESTVPGIRRRA